LIIDCAQVDEGLENQEAKLENTKKQLEDRMSVIEGSTWSGR
jgi:hypothetical protein